VTLLPRFDGAAALSLIERDHATIFEGVPTMFSRMLHAPNSGTVDVGRLRLCVSGGAAMPVEVMRSFEQTFGCALLEGYGLSETSPVATFNHPAASRKAGSIGTPIAGVEVRLVDDRGKDVPDGEVGEIAVRGPNVMKGYWGKPEETAEAIPDGWFRTGDLARLGEGRTVTIAGRAKDIIVRGGENISVKEIEDYLAEHPKIAEVAIVGVPDAVLGERACAFVVSAGPPPALADLSAFLISRDIARHKLPEHLVVVPGLPRTPSGKVQKFLLRQQASGLLAAGQGESR
jgi:long-chain acyl-CoA synthetase